MFSRPSAFESRVRLLLVLLALVLAAANVGNFLLVRSAREGLRDVEARLASEGARRALHEMGEGVVEQSFTDLKSLAVSHPPTELRARARRQGLLAIELVTPDGSVVSSSSPLRLGRADADRPVLGEEERRRLQAGMEAWFSPVEYGGESAMLHYLPIRSSGGVTIGLFKTIHASPTLGRVEAGTQIFAAAQALEIALVVCSVLLISRWIVRPYRLLAQAAVGAPEEIRPDPAVAENPDVLVTSFLRVIEKIRKQEDELKRLATESFHASSAGVGEVDPVGGFVKAIATTMVSGVIAVDRGGAVVAMNPAAERILRASADSSAGRPAGEILFASEDLVRLVDKTLADGVARSREVVTYRSASGETGHLGVALSPIAAEGAWPGGLLCLLSDLSEIGSLRERARLRENLATVGELSAGIAHEFRNSLATIIGYARLIERAASGAQVGDHARAIAREVESVRAAVDEFLRFARPARLSRTKVDLARLCAQVAEEVAMDGVMGGLEVSLEGELPEIHADETLLRAALSNLFRNAAESAPERNVKLKVTGEVDPKSDTVRLDLTDDGGGIPEQDLEKIFLPFFSTKQKGGGLGLAIAQKTVLDHDGSIDVVSHPGAGTTFRIVLPKG